LELTWQDADRVRAVVQGIGHAAGETQAVGNAGPYLRALLEDLAYDCAFTSSPEVSQHWFVVDAAIDDVASEPA
jgi:hypothetical protein